MINSGHLRIYGYREHHAGVGKRGMDLGKLWELVQGMDTIKFDREDWDVAGKRYPKWLSEKVK